VRLPLQVGREDIYRVHSLDIRGDKPGRGWCSTKTTLDDQHINGEGNFGFCSSSCPLVKDSGIIRTKLNKDEGEIVVFPPDGDDTFLFKEPNNLAPQ